MPGLFRNQNGSREGKYLVQRRDGTVPEWQWFVLGSRDPAAPAALMAYANAAAELGMDPQYVRDVIALASEFQQDYIENGPGDPDAGKHRTDNPEVIAKMPAKGST